jgi:hypothetical protein
MTELQDQNIITILDNLIENIYAKQSIEVTNWEKHRQEEAVENTLLWSLFEIVIKDMSQINNWKYKYEFMLTYNNHLNGRQAYTTPQSFIDNYPGGHVWSYQESFVTDFKQKIRNIITPTRDLNPKHLDIINNITNILNIYGNELVVGNQDIWCNKLYPFFKQILDMDESDRNELLSIWQYKDAFLDTMKEHSDGKQAMNDSWDQVSSFCYCMFRYIY